MLAHRTADARPVPPSPAFEAIAAGAQFRDLIAVRVQASPEDIFRELRRVTLSDMRLARAIGELRYLPGRLAGRRQSGDADTPFLSLLLGGDTLLLHDDAPREVITGSAAQYHHVIDQMPVHFADRDAFDAFDDPAHQKLFMSIRVSPTGVPGEQWLVLEHATKALSSAAARTFRRYWVVIKPGGAFVTRQLLNAIRRRAEGRLADARPWIAHIRGRSVRATPDESTRVLPGDELIARPVASLTHAITVQRPPDHVWPWLLQMGAGTRAGWYSYDMLDNGRRPSARRIVAELQSPVPGTIFPALPGATDGFTMLASNPHRSLILGLERATGDVVMTWAFVLEPVDAAATRLIVRARGAEGFTFQGVPWWIASPVARVVHFIMERRQLLGIADRVERMPGTAPGLPTAA